MPVLRSSMGPPRSRGPAPNSRHQCRYETHDQNETPPVLDTHHGTLLSALPQPYASGCIDEAPHIDRSADGDP